MFCSGSTPRTQLACWHYFSLLSLLCSGCESSSICLLQYLGIRTDVERGHSRPFLIGHLLFSYLTLFSTIRQHPTPPGHNQLKLFRLGNCATHSYPWAVADDPKVTSSKTSQALVTDIPLEPLQEATSTRQPTFASFAPLAGPLPHRSLDNLPAYATSLPFLAALARDCDPFTSVGKLPLYLSQWQVVCETPS